jgi:aminoglycoside 6'-N-acetyltransferase I
VRSQVPPMELEIRQVKPGDVALFDRVADAVFDERVDPGRLAAYLAEPGHHMLVALRAGEVVAQVAAVIHRHPDKPTELYIDEVGVTPALQRQGSPGDARADARARQSAGMRGGLGRHRDR